MREEKRKGRERGRKGGYMGFFSLRGEKKGGKERKRTHMALANQKRRNPALLKVIFFSVSLA